MLLTRLKINGLTEPIGYQFNFTDLSWNVEDATGTQAEEIRIDISDRPDFRTILFHTEGKDLPASGTNLDVPLSPRTRYYVRLFVQDETGDMAQAETFFETGKMEEPWSAQWIGLRPEDTFHPVFRKEFDSSGEITCARLYICGLGLYEAYINGEKVGTDVLAPFFNDYHYAIQVQTYDITSLTAGTNVLEVFLGNGWYKGRFGACGTTFGTEFALLAELHLEYADGKSEIIATDTSWRYAQSDIVESGIYDGEVQDPARMENPVFSSAVLLPEENAVLCDRFSCPLLVQETLPVKDVISTPAGETVLDFGQNFSGWVCFPSCQPEGTRIHLDFGEILQEGNFYNDNYRTAIGGFTYISNGREQEVCPRFTFFGFRYVRVTGWVGRLQPEDFKGLAIYSEMDETGCIETGHAKLGQLFSNCMWGQKSNFLDMPTDCPQRDERLGWTADAQVFTPTATYNRDTRAFYRKYLWDLANIQTSHNGGVPAYSPEMPAMCPICAVWGDAAAIIPYDLWHVYRNTNDLKASYPLMKGWVDYIAREMTAHYGRPYGIWDFTFQFGDWLALDGSNEQSFFGGTPGGFIGSFYYYQSLKMTAEAARALADAETAQSSAGANADDARSAHKSNMAAAAASDTSMDSSAAACSPKDNLTVIELTAAATGVKETAAAAPGKTNEKRHSAAKYTADAARYEALANDLREYLLYEFFTPAGHLSAQTQAAHIIALRFGIYRDSKVLTNDLVALLKKNNYRIRCGFVGAPLLCQTLSEYGREDVAYNILLQEDFPSWLYAVNLGATTIWERWNSVLPDGSISGTGMNSLNHYSYGSVIEFLYAYAAGLRPKTHGWDRAVIAPKPDVRLGYLNCSYVSPFGNYVSNWAFDADGSLHIHAEVPFGCTAEVVLPEYEASAAQTPLLLTAGSYDWHYMPRRDYRKIYGEECLLGDLFRNEEAAGILLAAAPQAAAFNNPENSTKQICDLWELEFMGADLAAVQAAKEKIKELKFDLGTLSAQSR